MRDVLIVIIVLLICGVILDGIRRMRAHRKETIRMSKNVTLAEKEPFEEIEDPVSKEFPAGGPRVVGVRDTSDVVSVNQSLRESYAASKMTRGAPRRQSEGNESLKLSTGVPMLMDSVEDAGRHGRVGDSEREPSVGSLDHLDDDYDENDSTDALLAEDDNENDEYQDDSVDEDFAEQERYAAEVTAEKAKAVQQHSLFDNDTARAKKANEAEATKAAARSFPDEVLVINVMARRGEQFAGPALLDAMLAEGLRFGDMDIFHRHETADGHGKILFSVANMLMPGTFALEAMDEFESPGISMFLSLPIAGDSLAAFNLMAESAQNIARVLGGELKDENRSVMTRQTFEHGRQRVLEYERKRRLAKA